MIKFEDTEMLMMEAVGTSGLFGSQSQKTWFYEKNYVNERRRKLTYWNTTEVLRKGKKTRVKIFHYEM